MSKMTLTAVDSQSALIILNCHQSIKETQAECLVNIRGQVICVSEVIRIKDKSLFMVKLLPHLDIIITRKEMLSWQTEISPYTEFIFTNLKTTTLQKGSQTPCLVYTVTKGSKLLKEEEVEVSVISAAEWLSGHGLHHSIADKHDDIQESLTDGLFSYQGKVTSVLDRGLGVFELDGAVRLYTSCVPAVHKFTMLNEGTTVLVQNAHHKLSKQYPKVSIYCCMLTSVRCPGIHTNTEADTKQTTEQEKLGEWMKKLLYLQGQTQGQLDQLFELRKSLHKQFYNILGQRRLDGIVKTVVSNKALNGKDSGIQATEGKRSFIDEFVNVPHRCSLQNMTKVDVQYQTLEELLQTAEGLSAESMEWQCRRNHYSNREVSVGILKLNEITGQVSLTDSTNSADIVSCCSQNRNVHTSVCKHTCCESCDCNRLCPGENFPCPYIQTCCIGKVVAVTEHEVVSETSFSKPEHCWKKNKSSKDKLNTGMCRTFILLDMRKVMYICNSTQTSMPKTIKCNKTVELTGKTSIGLDELKKGLELCNICNDACNPENRLTCFDSMKNVHCNSTADICGRALKDNDDGIVRIEVSALHKHLRENGGSVFCRKTDCVNKISLNDKCVQEKPENADNSDKTIEVHDLSKNSSTNNNVKCGKTTYKVKPISAKKRRLGQQGDARTPQGIEELHMSKLPKTEEDISRKSENVLEDKNRFDVSELLESCTETDVIIYLERKGALMMLGESSHRFNVDCTLVNKQRLDKVILEFTRDAARWYPVLHPGSLYMLSVEDQNKPVLSDKLPNDRLQKIVHTSKARRCLVVIQAVDIQRVWRTFKINDDARAAVSSIESMLLPDFSGSFVSIEGWIVSRTLVKPGFGPKSTTKDLSSSGMYSRLHVQDETGRHHIWVYLNDENIVNPLGLIPGSRVLFYTLERKTSKSLNIYCRFVPLSSIIILCMRTDRNNTLQNLPDESKDKSLPVGYLADLWSAASPPGHIFQSVCDIEKILKVSLKCLCQICGSLVVSSACSNPSCKGGEGWSFVARSSVIVDDSTSVAIVTLTGSSVQSMLKLSHDQWKCLEEEVSQSGEVFVQQYNPSLCTDLERFVYLLCDNYSVKRTWLMTLKCRAAVDINKINQDEFCMKSFETGSGRVSTLSLPFLQLEGVAMATFDPAQWSLHNLQQP